MQNQNPITLESLLGHLARNQNSETMYKTFAHLELLTVENLERVLRSFLDPVSFYIQYVPKLEDFEKNLRKEYERLRDDIKTWQVHWSKLKSSSTMQPEDLQGLLGLVCLTIELLNKARHRDQVLSVSTRKQMQDLLDDSAVRNWFYKVYEPKLPSPDPTNKISSTIEKEKEEPKKPPYQSHWEELKNENKCLELYRIGTTSFILRCQIDLIAGTELVLKCLLFPYTQIMPIVEATRNYATTYRSGQVPMTAKVRSSTDKWILMDFIEGPTLRELLDDYRNKEKSTPPLLYTDLIASIGQPLLKVLSLLPPNIQHEDLTPSNIIVSKDENGSQRIVLIDLGRNYLYMHDINFTENQEAIFIDPEIRSNKHTNTSDLYSFGMILIEIIDPEGVKSTIIPDKLYQFTPTLARFIEDLIDVKPDKRLLIFGPDGENDEKKTLYNLKKIYYKLERILADEVKVLPSTQDLKPGIFPWLQQVISLFFPFKQLERQRDIWKLTHRHDFWKEVLRLVYQRKLWKFLRSFANYPKLRRLAQSSKRTEIDRYSGRLYSFLVLCTIHWNVIFTICIVWGFWRDIEIGDFSARMSFAQEYIFRCKDACVPIIDWLGALAGYHADANHFLTNLPARLTIFSVMAQTKYYQNILVGLTAKPIGKIGGKRVGWTEFTLRGSAICSFIPIVFCNLYQPNLWLIMLVLGYIIVGINNILCYQLAIQVLKEAKGKLSTVIPFDDPILETFKTWGPNMIFYMILLLTISIGLYFHLLHDEWIYVIGTVGVSIFVWGISRCINLAPSIRGRLVRAFIAGERLEAFRKKNQKA